MLTSADKYIGKCFKYLSIYDKSFRRLIVNNRPDDGSLTVDYLCDILTPSSIEELPTPVTTGVFSESFITGVTKAASDRLLTLINILQMHYWEFLGNIVKSKRKWDAVSLIAAVLGKNHGNRGDKNNKDNEMVYYILIELYVQLSVMRTIGDHADLSIPYEDLEDYDSNSKVDSTQYAKNKI